MGSVTSFLVPEEERLRCVKPCKTGCWTVTSRLQHPKPGQFQPTLTDSQHVEEGQRPWILKFPRLWAEFFICVVPWNLLARCTIILHLTTKFLCMDAHFSEAVTSGIIHWYMTSLFLKRPFIIRKPNYFDGENACMHGNTIYLCLVC